MGVGTWQGQHPFLFWTQVTEETQRLVLELEDGAKTTFGADTQYFGTPLSALSLQCSSFSDSGLAHSRVRVGNMSNELFLRILCSLVWVSGPAMWVFLPSS